MVQPILTLKPYRSEPVADRTFVASQFSPWLLSILYPLGRYGVLPLYFDRITVLGQEHLPESGAVILAPTHRARWDAVIVPHVAGRDRTGRDLRFMVMASEMARPFQGWLIRHLGGFPIDPHKPSLASFRHGIELLQQREALVIFPEGKISYDDRINPLKPGLARLALQAAAVQDGLDIQVVPLSIHYDRPDRGWRCRVTVCIGQTLPVSRYRALPGREAANQLTADLAQALHTLDRQSKDWDSTGN